MPRRGGFGSARLETLPFVTMCDVTVEQDGAYLIHGHSSLIPLRNFTAEVTCCAAKSAVTAGTTFNNVQMPEGSEWFIMTGESNLRFRPENCFAIHETSFKCPDTGASYVDAPEGGSAVPTIEGWLRLRLTPAV